MLQIRNALSLAKRPVARGVIVPENGKPKLKDKYFETRVEKILNCYFDLLFGRFDLLKRLRDQRDSIARYYPNLAGKLFCGADISMSFLLKLLLDDPRKHLHYAPAHYSSDITAKEDLKAVISAFDYDIWSSKVRFAELIQLLDVNVCPYCGCMFTNTVKRDNGRYIRANQADHYFPKSEYPYLALSIFNLIPVCGPCNNRKNDKTDAFLYPYGESMGDDYRFETRIKNGFGYLVGKPDSEDDFQISLEPTTECLLDDTKAAFRKRAETEIETLGLRVLYSAHNAYVCSIFRQRYIFGDAYIDDLLATFPDLFKTREDVRAMLYMKRIEKEEIGNFPLDKLTRDIDFEIETLLYDTI